MNSTSDDILILHVDDEPGFADLVATFLTRENTRFEIETATSADEGFERLAANEFDCIVSDYDLPGKNGIEFLEDLRETYPDLPVILYTGKGSEEVASDAISAGVTDYLQKEDGTDQYTVLANRITNAVERYRSQWERERTLEFLQTLYDVATDPHADPDEKINRLLTIGHETLDLPYGHLTRIELDTTDDDAEGAIQTVIEATGDHELLQPGASCPLSQSYCRKTIKQKGLMSIHDTSRVGWVDEQAREKFDLGCYIGTKITVDGELYGTVFFAAATSRAEPFTEAERTFVRLLGQLVQYELERRQARQEQERIFDRMTDAVVAIDDEWRISYANERGSEMVAAMAGDSFPDGEVQGSHLWSILPDDGQGTELFERLHEAIDTQQPASFQSYYPPLDRWFEGRTYPSTSELSVYFRDITEERRREDQLMSRERTLREIYDVISDPDRTFDEQVEGLIEIGQRVIGTDYGSLSRIRGDDYAFEVVNAPEGTIQAGDVVDLSVTACERAVLDEETLVLADIAAEAPDLAEKQGYTEWGIRCYVGTPIFTDDEVYGTFCFYDTSAREAPFSEWQVTVVDLMGKWISYELTRERTELRLRNQNERLEEFVSVVSHDLRNPLRVAEGRLELARADCDSEHLNDVAAAHERMDALIDDLLTLAREGRAISEVESVALASLVEACRQNVETDDATLRTPIDRTVRADRDRLTQLIENLLRNAVEHGGQDVTITVGEGDEGFYVEDDGPGIPEDERDEVFEPGYSTTDEGTGFGLRIVEQIVEAHGWDIRVTDGSDGGARFEVTGVEFVE